MLSLPDSSPAGRPGHRARVCPACRYHTDPSGTYVKYRCMAIGSGSEGAQTALQEHYKDDMTLAEAEVLALTTLKQVMEEKVRACRDCRHAQHSHGDHVRAYCVYSLCFTSCLTWVRTPFPLHVLCRFRDLV